MKIARASGYLSAFLLLSGTAWATPFELITNGGFETGDFSGWTLSDLGDGSFFIDDADGFTPFSAQFTVGPATGSFYAVSDQPGPGTHALSQAFVVPAGASSVILSFDMFVNDWSDLGPIVDPGGLDHDLIPNQHGRVDLLSFGSPAFDTGTGVLANFYLGVDPDFDPNLYTPYSFDISALVAGGGTFVLRFAEVDNQFFMNLGVDNVSVLAQTPEPGALLFLLLAPLAVGAFRRAR